jgi:predicted ATPase/DNA-binding CsgD family transcriptional regulator/Tfp pilus assembly protein PilF
VDALLQIVAMVLAGPMDANATSAPGTSSATTTTSPAWSAPRTARLPLPPTSFFGREREIAECVEQLRQPDCRLLTLAGPGGVGKTRLAIEIARRAQADFPGGVVFVPLQPVRISDDLESAIAAALELPLHGGAPASEQLASHLATQSILLVLDNFEHLVERASLLSQLIPDAPGVRFLVTSRELLNTVHEWAVTVDGLQLPGVHESDEGTFAPAVSLFIDRARRVRHGFAYEAEAAATDRICRFVQGFPLAIELAASWTRAMSCAEIEAELRRSGASLGSALRDLPPNHRSMTAVFDHSWALLTDDERDAFTRLSIFQGGFVRSAAEAVAGADLQTLMRLVDKSLIRALPGGRFDMHELLRQYAESQLEAAGRLDAARDAHTEWMLSFLSERQLALAGDGYIEATAQVLAEIDNVRAAWRWAVHRGMLVRFPYAVEALATFYEDISDDLEGCTLFQELIDALESGPLDEDSGFALALASIGKGYLCMRLGRIDEGDRAFYRCRELLDRFQLPHNRSRATDPRIGLGINALIRGDLEAAQRFGDKALASAMAEDHPFNGHYSLYILARVAAIRGDFETARELALRSHAKTVQAGDRWFLGHILNELGAIAASLGELDEGRRYHEASFEERERANDRRGMAEAVQRLGSIALAQGDLAEAERRYQWALQVHNETHDAGAQAAAFHGLALTALAAGDCPRAAQHLRNALAVAQGFNYVALMLTALGAVGELCIACGRVDRGITLLTFVRDHPATEDEAIQRATYHLDQAQRHVSPGRFARAAQLSPEMTLEFVAGDVLGELIAIETTPAPALPEDESIPGLSRREQEVLRWLVAGDSNREIAARLGISEGTIKAHTANIYNKLGVDNRVQAAARAHELRLI